MKEKYLFISFVFIMLVLAIILFVSTNLEINRCKSAGGVFLSKEYVCAKANGTGYIINN